MRCGCLRFGDCGEKKRDAGGVIVRQRSESKRGPSLIFPLVSFMLLSGRHSLSLSLSSAAPRLRYGEDIAARVYGAHFEGLDER